MTLSSTVVVCSQILKTTVKRNERILYKWMCVRDKLQEVHKKLMDPDRFNYKKNVQCVKIVT